MRGNPLPVSRHYKVGFMNVSSWLWSWLDARRAEPSDDAIDHAARLSLRKLEDRQVLSVTPVFNVGTGLLDIDVDAGDNVTITVDGSGNVLINGSTLDIDPGAGVTNLQASQVQSIDVDAVGAFDNAINLSGVLTADFTSL